MGKAHEIMLGPDTWLKVGLQAQVWADYQQVAARSGGNDGGYTDNLFLRRGRVLLAAQFTKNVNAFFQLDVPRLGQALAGGTADAPTATKRFNAQDGGGMIVQDAFGEVKLSDDDVMLEAGLMIVPFGHNELQSTLTFLTLDLSTVAALIPNTSGTRDVGFQLKGYVADDKLEYRVGVFSGLRQPANATAGNPVGHDFFRVAGHFQYQLFDVDKGYTYAGTAFGKKKLVGLSAGFDFQKGDDLDAYYGVSAGAFAAWPLAGEAQKGGGDELGLLLEYYRYDGGYGSTPPKPTAGVPKQNDILVEAAYYNKDLALSFFGKFEMQKFEDDATGKAAPTSNAAGNKMWIGGGLKYYVADNMCNFTLAYNRVQYPDADSNAYNGTNEFTLQAQFFYF
jgi:hypothetical protein